MRRRTYGLIGALVVAAAGAALLVGTRARPTAGKTPVVVEMFTAEGCPGCPDGDAALDAVIRDASMPNVRIVALGEHVAYWDHLGWSDAYALPESKTRQSDYLTHVFKNGGLYTPQFVVDGQWQGSGTSAEGARRAIADAAKAPKAIVTVQPAWLAEAGAVRVRIAVVVPPSLTLKERADVVLALTEDRVGATATAGEHKGRTLQHSAVARVLKTVGTLGARERSWATTTMIPVQGGWKRADLQAVGLLQERESRRIVGADAARLTPQGSN
jgi:hypothetical protein